MWIMFVNTHTLKHTQENNIVATRPNQISYWSHDETHVIAKATLGPRPRPPFATCSMEECSVHVENYSTKP